jgi:hypothetical protein
MNVINNIIKNYKFKKKYIEKRRFTRKKEVKDSDKKEMIKGLKMKPGGIQIILFL